MVDLNLCVCAFVFTKCIFVKIVGNVNWEGIIWFISVFPVYYVIMRGLKMLDIFFFFASKLKYSTDHK